MQLVESYPNQIEPVVEALRFMTPLSLDILTYVILQRLTMERSKVKEDGINISDWLQSLSTFVAMSCRKHGGEMEISAICQLLSNALKRGESFDLLVLKVRERVRERVEI